MPVSVVDQYAGTDAAKVDRQLQALQNSHSLTTVMCSQEFEYTLTTSGSNSYSLSFATVASTDDFGSFSAQFNTWKVLSMRFDVYDMNPNVQGTAIFATNHVDGGNLTISLQTIADRPDSQLIPPGAGKISLTWVPKGTLENEFQGVSNYTDFGGLIAFANNVATASSKYSIVMKAIVQFRGRT